MLADPRATTAEYYLKFVDSALQQLASEGVQGGSHELAWVTRRRQELRGTSVHATKITKSRAGG